MLMGIKTLETLSFKYIFHTEGRNISVSARSPGALSNLKIFSIVDADIKTIGVVMEYLP